MDGGLVSLLRKASEYFSRTIVLFFDQFEELFIFNPAEIRKAFATELSSLLDSRLDVKILIAIRQEYLANLTELEPYVDRLFESKLWLRRMPKELAARAVRNACEVCGVGIEEGLAEQITSKLSHMEQGIELPYLQVVMDRLYNRALTIDARSPRITFESYRQEGEIGDILARFLEEEVEGLADPAHGRQVLKAFVTSEGSRRPVNVKNLHEEVANFGEPVDEAELTVILRTLVDRRILKEDIESGLLELRHDTLATHIHSWMSGLEKEIIEVREAIGNRFKEYVARGGVRKALLDNPFLDYLAPYERALALSSELADYVARSKGEASRIARRKKRIGATAAAVSLLVLLGISFWVITEKQRLTRGALARVFAKESMQAIGDKDWAKVLLYGGYVLKETKNGDLGAMVSTAVGAENFVPELGVIYTSRVSWIKSISFSSDGKLAAAGCEDGSTSLWDVEKGTRIAVLEGHKTSVTSVCFSRGGMMVAAGAKDGTIRVWDVSDRKEVARLIKHGDEVSSCSFSPDGRLLASGSSDRTIRLWDIFEGKSIGRLTGHSEAVRSVDFSPDGRLLASGSTDKTARLWDVETGKQLHSWEEQDEGVSSVSFSPDGKLLALGLSYGGMRLWDPESGKAFEMPRGHDASVRHVVFSPDGRLLASGSMDRTVRLWDVATRSESAVLGGHQSDIFSVRFGPDGSRLFSGSLDQTIRIWAVRAEKTTLRGHEHAVSSVSFSPDGRLLASVSADKTIRLWDTGERKELAVLAGRQDRVSSACFSPDGKLLAATSAEGTVLWDVDKRAEVKILQSPARSVCFSPDGKLLASGMRSGAIQLWDLATNREVELPAGHESTVSSLQFSPDGKLLASGSFDRTVRLWDVEAKREVCALTGHNNYVTSVSFSPDGKLLASCSTDGTIRLWDVETKKQAGVLENGGGVLSVAFSPDGGLLASGCIDRGVRVWDVGKRKEIAVLKGHSQIVTTVCFSPDGRLLASGSLDQTICLWPVAEDYTRLLPEVESYSSLGMSVTLDSNGEIVPGAFDVVARARLEAAKKGDIPWLPDGGKGCVPFYENTLGQLEKDKAH
jgi:WD40 repeat protein